MKHQGFLNGASLGTTYRSGKAVTNGSQAATVSEDSHTRIGVNVKVILRCRPFSDLEKKDASNFAVVTTKVESKDVCVSQTVPGRKVDSYSKTFTFDGVCNQYTTQKELFRLHVVPIVEEVLLGFNCTIFAYGQTGTGKTYTMEGDLYSSGVGSSLDTPRSPTASRSPNALSSPSIGRSGTSVSRELTEYAGIIPRAVQYIFERLESQDAEYSVRVSYLEIYNEELHDLLNDGEKQNLRIYEDTASKKGLSVDRLEELPVNNPQDIYNILSLAVKKRKTAETILNRQSSRSHCIFSVTIHMKESNLDGEDVIKIAGSENIQRSGANVFKDRTKEAGMINQSLLTLGRVINALVDRSSYIPYRDSKLTRLLQESLGGRTKTCIVATISPSSLCLEETLSTLDYAFRAKNIRNRPEVNQKLAKRVVIRELNYEIERLKTELQANREKNGVYLTLERYNEWERLMETQSQDLGNAHVELTKAKQEYDCLDARYQETLGKCREQTKQNTLLSEDNDRLVREIGVVLEERQSAERALCASKTSVLQLQEQATFLIQTLKGTGDQLNSLRSSFAQCQAMGYQLVACMDRKVEAVFERVKKQTDTFLEESLKGFFSKSQEYDAWHYKALQKIQGDWDITATEHLDPCVERTRALTDKVSQDVSTCCTVYLDDLSKQLQGSLQLYTSQLSTRMQHIDTAVQTTCDKIKGVSNKVCHSVREFQQTSQSFIQAYKKMMTHQVSTTKESLDAAHEQASCCLDGITGAAHRLKTIRGEACKRQRSLLETHLLGLISHIQKTTETLLTEYDGHTTEHEHHVIELEDQLENHVEAAKTNVRHCSGLSNSMSATTETIAKETDRWVEDVNTFCDTWVAHTDEAEHTMLHQCAASSAECRAAVEHTHTYVSQTFPDVIRCTAEPIASLVHRIGETVDTIERDAMSTQSQTFVKLRSCLSQHAQQALGSRKQEVKLRSSHVDEGFALCEAIREEYLVVADQSQNCRARAHQLFQGAEFTGGASPFSFEDIMASLPFRESFSTDPQQKGDSLEGSATGQKTPVGDNDSAIDSGGDVPNTRETPGSGVCGSRAHRGDALMTHGTPLVRSMSASKKTLHSRSRSSSVTQMSGIPRSKHCVKALLPSSSISALRSGHHQSMSSNIPFSSVGGNRLRCTLTSSPSHEVHQRLCPNDASPQEIVKAVEFSKTPTHSIDS